MAELRVSQLPVTTSPGCLWFVSRFKFLLLHAQSVFEIRQHVQQFMFKQSTNSLCSLPMRHVAVVVSSSSSPIVGSFSALAEFWWHLLEFLLSQSHYAVQFLPVTTSSGGCLCRCESWQHLPCCTILSSDRVSVLEYFRYGSTLFRARVAFVPTFSRHSAPRRRHILL